MMAARRTRRTSRSTSTSPASPRVQMSHRFVILTGLSLDYHVFVVSRIRENMANGMTTDRAVLDGVARTAGVVTSAAAVMVGVFATFGALTFVELKQIGVGLAVGILLDATVIRVIALPSMLMVCRRWLWHGSSR